MADTPPAASGSEGGSTASERSSRKGSGKRRGPGRPPSKQPTPIEVRGVVSAPHDVHNRLEFVYSEPGIFKSLFTYFKHVKARDIHLRCNPEGLTFFARDHSKTSRIVAHVSGAHVNWHYCDGEFWLGINREHVEKMFASIDKTFYKISVVQSYDDTNSLTLSFKDADIDKECTYKVVLSAYARDTDLYDAEAPLDPKALTTVFPIEFTLTAKQFKKTVTDAGNYSDVITFEKLGSHPLQLVYTRANIVYNEVYRSAAKVRLRVAGSAAHAFRCTVKIANIKSLASSMVTDDVRILCREDDDILFCSAIDARALVVSTLTRLV